jgi:hypothetical protein
MMATLAEARRKEHEVRTRRPDVRIIGTVLPMKYEIVEPYRQVAERLCAKFPKELENAAQVVNNILFIRNHEDRPTYKGRPKGAAVYVVPTKYHDILYATTGLCIDYILELYPQNWMGLTHAHITMLIYHQLRHIDREGKITLHDVEDWKEVEQKAGPDWLAVEIPDLLAEGVTWETFKVRSLFEEPGQEQAVKTSSPLTEELLRRVAQAATQDPGDPSSGLITVSAGDKSVTLTMDQFQRAAESAKAGVPHA